MSLAKRKPEMLEPKEWVTSVHLGLQQQIITFLLCAYGLLLVATMTMLFFEGFKFKGFHLEPSLLKWLGAATVGEIGGLLVLAFRASFR
jgi:hypothetical protein